MVKQVVIVSKMNLKDSYQLKYAAFNGHITSIQKKKGSKFSPKISLSLSLNKYPPFRKTNNHEEKRDYLELSISQKGTS